MTKLVIQPNINSCLGAVAAMATGKTFQDVINIIGHDGENGFSWIEIQYYFLHYNMFLGVGLIQLDEGSYFKIKDEPIRVDIYTDVPCMLSVDNEDGSIWKHALYWDGNKHYDPSRLPGKIKISEYKIDSIWPITTLTGEALKPAERLFPGHRLKMFNNGFNK